MDAGQEFVSLSLPRVGPQLDDARAFDPVLDTFWQCLFEDAFDVVVDAIAKLPTCAPVMLTCVVEPLNGCNAALHDQAN